MSLFFASDIVIKNYHEMKKFYERIFPQIMIFLKNQLWPSSSSLSSSFSSSSSSSSSSSTYLSSFEQISFSWSDGIIYLSKRIFTLLQYMIVAIVIIIIIIIIIIISISINTINIIIIYPDASLYRARQYLLRLNLVLLCNSRNDTAGLTELTKHFIKKWPPPPPPPPPPLLP